jgi:Mn2+/Fe2+ NRAMP family transporter
MENLIIIILVGLSAIFSLQLPIWMTIGIFTILIICLSSGEGLEKLGKMIIALPIMGGLAFGLVIFIFQTKNLSDIPNPFVYNKSLVERPKEVQKVSISEKNFKEFKEFQKFMKQRKNNGMEKEIK